MSVVTCEKTGGCAILRIDHPPVNVLSHSVRAGLVEALARAAADEEVSAIVLLCSGRTFIAGADITEFGTPAIVASPSIWDMITALETSPKPVVAAMHGTALGGGLETALACHGRVALASTKMGLPEVQLGILPGAGGTQRLPRLTGPGFAIDCIASGRSIDAAQALEAGLIDAIVEDLEVGAIAHALSLARQGLPVPVLQRQALVSGYGEDYFAAARSRVAAKARGALAPLAIVDCIEAACTRPGAEGLLYEQQRALELMAGPQHAALKYYFFAEREARKIPGIAETSGAIRTVAVIGSGTMGGGIAMACANAGFPVRLVDIDQAALDRGMGVIAKNYAASVARGSTPQGRADAALGRIGGQVGYGGLVDVDLAIEAVFEDLTLKQRVFAELDRATGPDAILATNTSTLDIDAIARATSRPDKVVGMHFFSPANVMRLLENVRGSLASAETVGQAMAFGRALGKVTVLAGNCDGFIGNRMLRFYTDMTDYLLEAGATPERIDRVATDFGMPMGPCAMWDMVGIDTGVLLRKSRWAAAAPGDRMSPILERLAEAGRVGQKAGKGFYAYEGREKRVDPETRAIIAEVMRERGGEAASLPSDEEIRDRLFFPLVNEGARELEDGTALRAGDIDVVWVNGYGFPAHKGGPMWWGQAIGLSRVADLAARLAEEIGPRWAPAASLLDRARSGRGW